MIRTLLILFLLPLSSYSLPKCEGEDYKKWTSCVGTYTTSFGVRYKGEFKDGLAHGKGSVTFAHGEKYVGEFKDGIKHGKGTFTLANGDKYEGGWKDNVMHGKGTYTYANGDKYAMEGKLIREVDKDE